MATQLKSPLSNTRTVRFLRSVRSVHDEPFFCCVWLAATKQPANLFPLSVTQSAVWAHSLLSNSICLQPDFVRLILKICRKTRFSGFHTKYTYKHTNVLGAAVWATWIKRYGSAHTYVTVLTGEAIDVLLFIMLLLAYVYVRHFFHHHGKAFWATRWRKRDSRRWENETANIKHTSMCALLRGEKIYYNTTVQQTGTFTFLCVFLRTINNLNI